MTKCQIPNHNVITFKIRLEALIDEDRYLSFLILHELIIWKLVGLVISRVLLGFVLIREAGRSHEVRQFSLYCKAIKEDIRSTSILL